MTIFPGRPLALVLAAWLLAGCGGASSTAPGSTGVGPSIAGAGATEPPTTDASGTEPPFSFPTCLDDPTKLHQASELEAQLPDTVDNRTLAQWSIRGRCALELVFEDTPGGLDELLADIDALAAPPMDLEHVAYAVAGRSDTRADPPYFVNAALRPDEEDEIGLNLLLLLGGGGFTDLGAAVDLEGFEVETIGGKDPVYVGTAKMLTQDSHQRGRPYLYQTDDTMFLVITDDEAWAQEALEKLP